MSNDLISRKIRQIAKDRDFNPSEEDIAEIKAAYVKRVKGFSITQLRSEADSALEETVTEHQNAKQ
jgi:hypothetical protein